MCTVLLSDTAKSTVKTKKLNLCYRALLSEARRRIAMNQLALCLGYTHLIWYAANRCVNRLRIRPYKQYQRDVVEEQH